jgi:hypothetical protein
LHSRELVLAPLKHGYTFLVFISKRRFHSGSDYYSPGTVPFDPSLLEEEDLRAVTLNRCLLQALKSLPLASSVRRTMIASTWRVMRELLSAAKEIR